MNNPILSNAAQSGFTAGVYSQAVDIGSGDATDADIAFAAAAFAALVDGGIATEPTLTSDTAQALSKALLLHGICFAKAQAAVIGGSLPDPPPTEAMSDLVAGVTSAYLAGAAQLSPV